MLHNNKGATNIAELIQVNTVTLDISCCVVFLMMEQYRVL